MRTDAPGVLGVEAETLHILREAAIPRRRGGATDIGGRRCGPLHPEIKERRIRRVKARTLGRGKKGFGGPGQAPPTARAPAEIKPDTRRHALAHRGSTRARLITL